MKKLPVLISIPHGGTQIPMELWDRVCLSPVDLLDDSDAFTRQIYGLGKHVYFEVQAKIARAFVDLNRAPNDRPPQNPDGIIKSMTCYQRPIYKIGDMPDETLANHLIKTYYEPYHRQIQQIQMKTSTSRRVAIELALDCHSMAAVGPAIAPDPGQKRPMICLGNRFHETSSSEMIETLADCFRQSFAVSAEDVAINEPFAGGYITRTYGAKPIPWIQVEISRALYLESPYFNRETLEMDPLRLRELNHMFAEGLRLFFQ